MVCIHCGNKTQIYNSRSQKKTNQVWRRRRCTICGAVFTSIETADYSQSWLVLNSDGDVRPFSRDKLFLSILESCKHRPTAIADAGGLCDTVMAKLAPSVIDGQVAAVVIIQTVQVALHRFDKPAASHYQVFHKS